MAPRLEIDRRTIRLISIAFLLLAGLTVHRLFLSGPGEPDVAVLSGQTMGTTWEIRIPAEGLDDESREKIQTETERRLARVNAWMSDWNPRSEVSRFNEWYTEEPFPVSDATADVVALALQISRKTEGAFDVTVGPLVAAWGFGRDAQANLPPSDEYLATLRSQVGFEKLTVLPVDRNLGRRRAQLIKLDPLITLDLSSIAKGFGVDHVSRGLAALGHHDHLVEIGGELRASGQRPGGGPWRVAVERPQEEGRSIHSIVPLSDQAMATSGDYRSYYLEHGQRRSHTIDPRKGTPIDGPTASASVVAPTAVEADAWATALMVLGAEQGLAMAEREGLGAMILERSGDGTFRVRRNALFPAEASAP